MDDTTTTTLEMAEEAVERAVQKAESKQPRFQRGTDSVFGSIYYWLNRAELDEPSYKPDTRTRDRWLRQFSYLEPHWLGALNSVCQIDSNRGWTLVGGRNQVNTYTNIFHNTENGEGWRTFIKRASLSYRRADIGSVVELGRMGEGGPLRSLYNVDPARCKLTGNVTAPLQYYPSTGTLQKWQSGDYFRVVSFPNDDESFNGVGYCATSKALELVKLLYGVLMHDQEQIGARMPRGIMFLQGVEEDQWRQALEARKEHLNSEDRRWFGGVMVLASAGQDQIGAQLVGLSALPAGFDRSIFIDQVLYGYALIVGYAPGEFWPVRFGSLGRGREEEMQGMRATSKGGLEFVLGFQERLQQELPDSLHFEFEQRDEAGQLLQAEVAQAWADVTDKLRKRPSEADEGTLTREEARSMLVAHNIIPPEWTEVEEDTQATDTREPEEERWLSVPEVRRAVEMFPSEPIVRYHWPTGVETVLWERGMDAVKRYSWPVAAIVRENLASGSISATDAATWALDTLEEVSDHDESARLTEASSIENIRS